MIFTQMVSGTDRSAAAYNALRLVWMEESNNWTCNGWKRLSDYQVSEFCIQPSQTPYLSNRHVQCAE
jgi:hypothetical protein